VTTLTAAREAIYQAFVTGWGSTSAYTFDGEDYNPPVGAAWVRISVRHFESRQWTLGGIGERKFIRRGLVFLQFFLPGNKGARDSDALVTAARNIFEGVHLPSDIRFTSFENREIGRTDGWYQVNAEAYFEYDERK
jgi:hypothetical protein